MKIEINFSEGKQIIEEEASFLNNNFDVITRTKLNRIYSWQLVYEKDGHQIILGRFSKKSRANTMYNILDAAIKEGKDFIHITDDTELEA